MVVRRPNWSIWTVGVLNVAGQVLPAVAFTTSGHSAGDIYLLPYTYAAGTQKALGPLANTQGKVTAGPWSPGWVPPKAPARGG